MLRANDFVLQELAFFILLCSKLRHHLIGCLLVDYSIDND